MDKSPNLELFHNRDLKILVVIPNPGVMLTPFVMSLVNMMTYCQQHRFGRARSQNVMTMQVQGSMLGKMRREGIEAAVEQNADYLFFVDTDHEFPKSTLHRLLSWDVPVVAANCVTKTLPCRPTARSSPTAEHRWGQPVYSDPEKSGLEQVWRVGTGLMLVSVDALRKIDRNHAFDAGWNDQAGCDQGEDWTFVHSLDKAGVPIYIDHDLSRKVTHVGYYRYTHDEVGEIPEELVNGSGGRQREVPKVENRVQPGAAHNPPFERRKIGQAITAGSKS